MFSEKSFAEPLAQLYSLDLVEEFSHRVFNEYTEAISMLSLAASRADSDSAKVTLAMAADRLRDHAASHRTLLPPTFEGAANLADYIGQICRAFTKATLADRGIRLILRTDDVVLPADRCWRVGLVVAELIRNAARHGLGGGGGLILVRFTQHLGEVTCLVCDTGRASAKKTSSGRGQKLIRSLVADLDGAVEWSFTPQGGIARMQFPVADRLL
jgi:two-component sensor histidine kinase